MSLQLYTTFADIRSILGVTTEELPDSDLELESYLFGLQNGLDSIGSTLEAEYITASSAVSAGTETSAQKLLYRATRMYATAEVSLAVAYSLPMRAQKSITDGKAGLSRFTDSPFRDTLENLKGLVASAKSALEAAFTGASAKTVIPSFMSVVSPAIDPVVGE